MTVLVGQEAEGSASGLAGTVEIGQAVRYEVLATGTIEALHVVFSANLAGTVTSVRLAVVADAAGPLPQTTSALAEGAKASPGEVKAAEVTGLSLAVVKGEFVWLAVETIGAGYKIKAGTTKYASRSTAKKSTIAAMGWSAVTEQAPMSIWATGTESGGSVGKLEAAIKGTGSTTSSASAVGVLRGKTAGVAANTGKAAANGVLKARSASTSVWNAVTATGLRAVIAVTGAVKAAATGTAPARARISGSTGSLLPGELPFELGPPWKWVLTAGGVLAARSSGTALWAAKSVAGGVLKAIQAAVGVLKAVLSSGEEPEDHHATLVYLGGRQATLHLVASGRQATLQRTSGQRQATLRSK